MNDNVDEVEWAEMIIQAVEGGLQEEEVQRMFDDLTGKELNAEDVKGARKEEIEFVKKLKVYEEKLITECIERTGKPPIKTRWVDILKGLITRSRWVAQDFKTKGDNQREDLFASMPPLEAKKALFRIGAVRLKGKMTKRGTPMKMLFIDVRKAYLNAMCEKDDVYVALPEEAGAPPGTCGRLLRWLYGMRGAAQG